MLLPELARRLSEADAVVVGEAEEIWPAVVADRARGRLRKRYVARARPDISTCCSTDEASSSVW